MAPLQRGDLVAAVDYGRRMLSGVEIQGLDEGQETHRQVGAGRCWYGGGRL